MHWHLTVVFPRLRVTPVHCNLVSAFSIVLCCFACKILDACVFAMNFCAFCMIIENKRKNLAQQRNEIMQCGRTKCIAKWTRDLNEKATWYGYVARKRLCNTTTWLTNRTNTHIANTQQINLVSHIIVALLALFSFNFIVELHAEAMLNFKIIQRIENNNNTNNEKKKPKK